MHSCRRDKRSTPEFVSRLLSSNVLLTLAEIWQNLLFWILDSCYVSSAMHSIITVGMLSVIWVLNREDQQQIVKRHTFNASRKESIA